MQVEHNRLYIGSYNNIGYGVNYRTNSLLFTLSETEHVICVLILKNS